VWESKPIKEMIFIPICIHLYFCVNQKYTYFSKCVWMCIIIINFKYFLLYNTFCHEPEVHLPFQSGAVEEIKSTSNEKRAKQNILQHSNNIKSNSLMISLSWRALFVITIVCSISLSLSLSLCKTTKRT